MNKYYINYGTGAGNFEVEGTLEQAMKEAENGVAYTQKSVRIEITIEDEYGNKFPRTIAVLPWYEYEPEENEKVTCQFDEFGFYGEWEVLEND